MIFISTQINNVKGLSVTLERRWGLGPAAPKCEVFHVSGCMPVMNRQLGAAEMENVHIERFFA